MSSRVVSPIHFCVARVVSLSAVVSVWTVVSVEGRSKKGLTHAGRLDRCGGSVGSSGGRPGALRSGQRPTTFDYTHLPFNWTWKRKRE